MSLRGQDRTACFWASFLCAESAAICGAGEWSVQTVPGGPVCHAGSDVPLLCLRALGWSRQRLQGRPASFLQLGECPPMVTHGWKLSATLLMFSAGCVCVCVHACVHACVCVCVHIE